ncbi:hypothetical protein CERZMDRAFT_89987 [Cercospora zeae-maydis SCOH1-5]|uniref:Uncharacterized protein n=1 Tax=Cercospora zeae-maydis SCOH1-5 TaxID=717836 RepID=A0A6A6FQT5_9PEZI|nr:hypothetical protein CERZMDRAFT_89987 [Cercospora zeae-maydis SCOH1-5]
MWMHGRDHTRIGEDHYMHLAAIADDASTKMACLLSSKFVFNTPVDCNRPKI